MSVIQKHENDQLVLFYRDDSPNIFCRIKLDDGTWETQSLKTKSVEDAYLKAKSRYDEIRVLERNGHSPKRRTFSSVCDIYIRELKNEVELGFRNERNLIDYEPIVERYFRPYFSKRYISKITTEDIAAYQDWRKRYWIDGPGSKEPFIEFYRNGKLVRKTRTQTKPPSRNSLNKENGVLRNIFATAEKHKLIRANDRPTITNIKQKRSNNSKTSSRSAFEEAEYEKLLDFLYAWPAQYEGNAKFERLLLIDYVLILADTGIRPGTESDSLTWKNITHFTTEAGRNAYKLIINGKTGIREPVTSKTATVRLGSRYVEAKFAEYTDNLVGPVFRMPDGTHVKNDRFRRLFNQALDLAGLRLDKEGKKRSLYSLRHTFATFQLLINRLDFHTLAVQMGTSYRMVEQHYSHLTPQLAADHIIKYGIDDKLISKETNRHSDAIVRKLVPESSK